MSEMKKILCLGTLLLPVTTAAQPSFSGYLQLDKRFVTGGDSTYIDNFYNRLRLEMKAPAGHKR